MCAQFHNLSIQKMNLCVMVATINQSIDEQIDQIDQLVATLIARPATI